MKLYVLLFWAATIVALSAKRVDANLVTGNWTSAAAPCQEENKGQAEVPHSLALQTLLKKSENAAVSCATNIHGVSRHVEIVDAAVQKVSSAVTKVDTMAKRISSVLSVTIKAINKVLKLAARIPKVGKILRIGASVLDVISVSLRQLTKQMSTVSTAVGRLAKGFSLAKTTVQVAHKSYESTATGMSFAANMHQKVIDCVLTPPPDCGKVSALEAVSKTTFPPLQAGYQAIQVCDDSFQVAYSAIAKLMEILQKLPLDKLEAALADLWRFLEPILKEFDRLVIAVQNTLTEAYCCVTPRIVQELFHLATKLINVATCPLDPMFHKLEEAIGYVVSSAMTELANVFVLEFFPVVETLQEAQKKTILGLPNLGEFRGDLEKCILEQPHVSTQTIPLLPNAFQDIPRQIERPTPPKLDLGDKILKACKESLEDLGELGLGSCCVEYKGFIPDQYYCDPLEIIPYKHCSMCRGQRHSFWYSKTHHGCGIEPCWPSGTTCIPGVSCQRCCNGVGFFKCK